MHIILNSLGYALWLMFCLFRHAVVLPAAFGGALLLAWFVFGHPVSDLNGQLQKEATAWRIAPPGHYMWEECPVPDNADPPEAKPAACTVTAVTTETAVHNYLLALRAVWIVFLFLSNVLYVLSRLLAKALHYHSQPCREAGSAKGTYTRRADGKIIKETDDE